MTRSIQLSSLLALAAAIGCGETTNFEIPQLTFDRPVDIAFTCYGGLRLTNGEAANPDQPIVASAMPASACEERAKSRTAAADPPPVPPGQEDLRSMGGALVPGVEWYGLVLESGPGTVALLKFGAGPATTSPDLDGNVLDADPFTPGINGISVGEEPVAIVTDPAGCHAITANAGSCDLSVLDINSALGGDRAARVDRLAVKNASGAPIRARATAMVGEPSSEAIGLSCPASPSGLVYIAYPSCHLVAGVDTSTGTIVTGIQYDAAGVPSIVDGNVTCPDECGGGVAVTPGVRPVAIDLEVDLRVGTRRLAIGADNSASLAIVELDVDSRPLSVSQVALEDPAGTLGVTALSLSPEIGMGGGAYGTLDPLDEEAAGGPFQFIYAVATDGTVRVADVLDLRRECDTQIDARFARDVQTVRELSCMPVGAATTPRRAGARSPGIHLPGAVIPLSVEIFPVPKLPTANAFPLETRTADVPGTLVGYFALISTSNGSTYLVNVDDDDHPDLFNPGAPLEVPVQLAMAHQLRDAAGDRSMTIDDDDKVFNPMPEMGETDGKEDDKSCDYAGRFSDTGAAIGGPRASATPERRVSAGTVATSKLTQLPGFRQLRCDRRAHHGDPATDSLQTPDHKAISELVYAAPEVERDRAFPDLMSLPEAETWTIAWEGSLSLNTGGGNVNGPAVRESLLTVDGSGLHVLDDSKPFCDAGVEPFDILQLRGCDPSVGAADCPSGYTCFVHPDSKIQGLGACMLRGEANRLANACKDFLTTSRRYTIKTTTSGELLAMPRRHELRTTPLDGCVDDQQCQALADHAARSGSDKHPFQDTTAPDPRSWACVADPLRAPKGGTGRRCELTCDTTDDCLSGTVCQGAVAGQPRSGFCMEGVIPPQACINASQRYELRAGEAFSVIGSVTGFVHPIIEGAGGTCVRDPMASHLSIGRLPLVPREPGAPDNLHACDPTADPLTGQLPNGTFELNPCLTTAPHIDVVPRYTGAQCALPPQNMPQVELVERQAPAVRFRNRNMTFTLVDPHYPGDGTCILDRQGNLGQIPHVVPGYSLTFRQVGGAAPVRLLLVNGAEDRPSFPVKVVRGPTNSVWVVDEGDFLSSSAGAASTRGKVYRIEPLAPGLERVFK